MPYALPHILAIGAVPLIVVVCLAAAGVLVPVVRARQRLGWEITTYLCVLVPLLAVGLSIWLARREGADFMGIWYVAGVLILAVAGMGVLVGVMEFVIMRLLGLSQLGAIARVTYYEGLLQPFTQIILFAGVATIGLSARLAYFTYNEDFKMFRDVASSFVFLFSLPIMVFASTKVIDEEIENRTMLTLMSKPVSRTQVVVGKYLGVLMLIFVAVAMLGIMAGVCSYMRYFDDNTIDYSMARGDPKEVARLNFENFKAVLALFPSLVLTFLQVASLGAISVAISTRFGLAVNVTVVAVIYLAASLARYMSGAPELRSIPVVPQLITFGSYILPGLGSMDLNQRLVFSNFILGDEWGPSLPTYGAIWKYVGTATLYAFFYISAILSFGVALFRSRELS
ncbi:MAG TPA: ABC transporter permease [Phycisphaerae bacterium]|nr:ABC transporter permease [Phycisphaerae bacterium]